MLDKRRTSPDPESEQAIFDPDFFTLSRTLDLASGKSVDCSILRPESQDLPGPASAARALWKKRGGQQYDSRDARVFLGQSLISAGKQFLKQCLVTSLPFSR